MSIIALTEELGSLDKEVAEQVAQELGLRLVYVEVLDDIRRQSHCAMDAVSRIVEGRAGRLECWRNKATRFNAFARRALFEQARKGDVVLRGWVSPVVFWGTPQVVKIHITAPLEARVRNLKSIFHTDDESVICEKIRRSDHAFSTTLRSSIRPEGDINNYVDLVLDTGKSSVAQCVDAIVRLTRLVSHQETATSVTALRKKVLLAQVRAELEQFGANRRIQAEVSDKDDVVALEGMVSDRSACVSIEDAIARISGVAGVKNKLRPIWGHHRANGVSNF